MNTLKARITGLGSYLPEKILLNQDLEKLVDTSDEWIVSRTGIRERRMARDDEFSSDMGTVAARIALKKANVQPAELDMVLVATMTPDYISPSTAALIQANLKASKAAAVDLQAACTGYLYALSMARAYIESGMARHVLVVATEKMSSIIDYTDRNTCVLFGDGASAAVVSSSGSGLAIDAVSLGADGELAQLVIVPAGGSRAPASHATVDARQHFFKMNGKEVFKHAVRRMAAAARDCLEGNNLSIDKINWIIPHQANIRIIEAIAAQLCFPIDKVYRTLHKYGNTSGSSVAIALEELSRTEELKEGERYLLVAFGGGLTWGAAILSKVR